MKTTTRSLALCALALLGSLAAATDGGAAPLLPAFLAVDMNGYNADTGQSIGPTEAGHQGWEAAEGLFVEPAIDWGSSGAAGITRAFATSEGNITATLHGVAPSAFVGARNRGANLDALGDLTQDFVFAQRGVDGFGQTFVRLQISGLSPLQQYEVTMFARDSLNVGTDSFQAWTDRAALGGLDGPGAWMNANVGPGAVYQPAVGGTNNPLPTLGRSATSGPSSVDPFGYAATFLSTADAAGLLTVYGWADANTFSGTQTATLLNGFQVGVANPVPEPVTLALLGLGVAAVVRRRRA